MSHSHSPPAKKGATRPGQGHAMASHECRRGGGPDTPTPDQKQSSDPGPAHSPGTVQTRPTLHPISHPKGPQSKAPPRVPPTMPPPRDGGRTSPLQSAAGAQQRVPPRHPGGQNPGRITPPPLWANPTPQRPAGPSVQRPRPPTPTRSAAPAQPQLTAHHPNPHGPPRPRWQPPHKSTPTPVGQTHSHRGTVDPGPPTHTDHQTSPVPQMHGPQHHGPTREDTVTTPP
uniref:proline-rich protein 2-like n=1 Tax=Solea senegalensis TaxID=28829 RepID=UPI001CD84D1D|nr:proline-rich protein 2-like [Solea senegalensis]